MRVSLGPCENLEPLSQVSETSQITLIAVPPDILHDIFDVLYECGRRNPVTDRYDLEVSKGRLLLPLSMCCRYLRAQTLPWIFREVYNWDMDDSVWPETLWPFIRCDEVLIERKLMLNSFSIINVRDRSLRNPGPIVLTPTMLDALTNMPAVVKVTVRLTSAIQVGLLHALSQAPQLKILEFFESRLDGTFSPSELSFPHLGDQRFADKSTFKLKAPASESPNNYVLNAFSLIGTSVVAAGWWRVGVDVGTTIVAVGQSNGVGVRCLIKVRRRCRTDVDVASRVHIPPWIPLNSAHLRPRNHPPSFQVHAVPLPLVTANAPTFCAAVDGRRRLAVVETFSSQPPPSRFSRL
ncbi:hypothetical protein R3P38DRAFT_3238221 [Favolaschia claudopus]|uniref:F-box domain-containing protein n=1 Tax=Favolaschia claudopus TaxID=2862362 RepID=A0AAV9Z9W6_9AGAR